MAESLEVLVAIAAASASGADVVDVGGRGAAAFGLAGEMPRDVAVADLVPLGVVAAG